MKILKTLKRYPSQIIILDTTHQFHILDYDGQCGQFTRDEWIENDEIVSQFEGESQNTILNALEDTSNISFFKYCN